MISDAELAAAGSREPGENERRTAVTDEREA